MKRLSGKVAFVTGASPDVGRAIAKRLAEEGALVAINYADNVTAATSLVAEIEGSGGEAFALEARVGSVAETAGLFTALDNELIRRRRQMTLNILVNLVGIRYFSKLSDTAGADFDDIFEANLTETSLVTKSALPRMAEGGRIFNISSGASKHSRILLEAYAMTKTAIDAMTLTPAVALRSGGIAANAVAPGWIAGEIIASARQVAEFLRKVVHNPLRRLGTPEDIAAVVAFLVSDESRWLMGQWIEPSCGSMLV